MKPSRILMSGVLVAATMCSAAPALAQRHQGRQAGNGHHGGDGRHHSNPRPQPVVINDQVIARPIVVGRPIVIGGSALINGSTAASRYAPMRPVLPTLGLAPAVPYRDRSRRFTSGGFGVFVPYLPTYTSVFVDYPPVTQYPNDPNPAERQPAAPALEPSGLSFAIAPAHAFVYVDGVYAGTAGTFAPPNAPLFIAPGEHRLEIQSPGYRTAVFDLTIDPGQVIPYEGTLVRD